MGNRNLFTLIPKIDELLEKVEIKELINRIPRKTVVDAIREEIEDLRGKIKNGISEDEIMKIIDNQLTSIEKRVYKKDSFKLRRCINATGVVLHTNLGRSLINREIMENVLEVASHYSNLEFDLEKGLRGSRYSHLEEIIKEVVGGEAAMVVNNNAAAVMLVLSTMAKGKEVIVSRGELIEIGGSFRIPDVMAQSGAHLVEVGTTNKTHLWDYENAITENTAALLKVHTSNYRVVGFTSAVDSEELSILKEKYGIPVIEDLGSGVLVDLSKYSLEYENTVQDSLRRGVDVVTFSGDKLLGGPQAGIIVGKKEFIDACKKNPLTRAFRVDKFTIAALEGTLKYYLDENKAMKDIPTLRMLTMPIEVIDKKANRLRELIQNNIGDEYLDAGIEESYSEVGGGSLPTERIPTKCLVLNIKKISINTFEEKLRHYHIPLITRLNKERVYLDLRTIEDGEMEIVVDAIKFALGVEGSI